MQKRMRLSVRFMFLCSLVGCVFAGGTASLAAQTVLADSRSRPAWASAGDRAVEAGALPGQAAASATDDRESQRRQLVIWWSILGATVAATVVGDVVNQGLNFPETFVPVAGPFIALARYDNVVNPSYSGRTTDKVLFAASGILQTVSLVMIIKSLRSRNAKDAGGLRHVPAVSLVPTGRHGFLLSYRSQF